MKVFTDEQKQFIIENYSKMTNKEIAELFGGGITPKQVKGFADGKKLRKGNQPPRRTAEEKEYILKWYNKKPTGEIAKDLGLTTKQVNDFAYNQGLESEVVRYEVNENFFDVIDTEEKAYWLGFLYADGCIVEFKRKDYVKSRCLELGLSKNDLQLLETFKSAISSTHPITYKIVNGQDVAVLKIHSTALCNALITKGCTPRKSLTLTFPDETILPKHLINHFIRGYFDGDGCAYVRPDLYAYLINFVGTHEFLTSLQDVFESELGLTRTVIKSKGRAFQTQWGGKNNMKKLREFLYKDSTVSLLRKKEKIDLCIA